MIKVILWDLDGTLLNFNLAEAYAIRKGFAQYQLGECTDEMLARYSEINLRHWKMLEKGLLTKEDALVRRFQEFFKEQGVSCDPEKIPEFNRDYQIHLSEKIFFHEYGEEIVKDLKPRVKQYVVTNGTRLVQERKLERSGLDQVFDGIFISDCIGYDKPNVKFFDYVLEAIGPYEKDEILIVGDSLTSDIQGGNNAGIRCCWFNPEKEEKPEALRIDYEIRNLKEVLDIIG